MSIEYPLIRDLKKDEGLNFNKEATSTLLEQWNIMRDSGRIAGALWATVTHPNSNSEVVDKVYGEVHMLSHLAGASTHKQAEALPNAQREIKTLQTKLKNQQSE